MAITKPSIPFCLAETLGLMAFLILIIMNYGIKEKVSSEILQNQIETLIKVGKTFLRFDDLHIIGDMRLFLPVTVSIYFRECYFDSLSIESLGSNSLRFNFCNTNTIQIGKLNGAELWFLGNEKPIKRVDIIDSSGKIHFDNVNAQQCKVYSEGGNWLVFTTCYSRYESLEMQVVSNEENDIVFYQTEVGEVGDYSPVILRNGGVSVVC